MISTERKKKLRELAAQRIAAAEMKQPNEEPRVFQSWDLKPDEIDLFHSYIKSAGDKKRIEQLTHLSDKQKGEIKNLIEQMGVSVTKKILMLAALLNASEFQLLLDYARCNGVERAIARERKRRNEKKCNPVSVKTDLDKLMEKPLVSEIMQEILRPAKRAKIYIVGDIDKYSARVNYPAALARARAIIDPANDDLETVIAPQKRGESLERLLGEDEQPEPPSGDIDKISEVERAPHDPPKNKE